MANTSTSMFDTDRATIDITAVQSVDSILALFILSKSNETKTTAETAPVSEDTT
jgi:hypothetical protein